MSSDPESYKRTKKEDFNFNDDVEDIYKAWGRLVDPSHWVQLTYIIKDLIDHKVDDIPSLTKRIVACRRVQKQSFKKAHMLHVLMSMREQGELDIDEQGFENLRKLLVKKGGKSNSGVLVVTVLTSPYPKVGDTIQKFSCQWNCYYCPDEPDQPRSYLHDEPSVLRANRNRFDAVLQFCDRAVTLAMNGHPVDKIELLILGGTWASYPVEYQESFIRDLFYAANTFFVRSDKRARVSLAEEKALNEKAQCKIIGITLETRPDCITEAELRRFRKFGCTRIQLGIQHTSDAILKKINRGCTTADTKRALRLLKDSCYKVDIHLMPNLPGASPDIDRAMFKEMLNDEDLHADQWKIYPCETTPWTVIQKWYESGKYKPYSEAELLEVLIEAKAQVHPWIRLNRVIRDIPSQYILGGVNNPSMRQVIQDEMHRRNMSCKCIRCREVRDQTPSEIELVVRRYNASGAIEYFISFETPSRDTIMGFARLRINKLVGTVVDESVEPQKQFSSAATIDESTRPGRSQSKSKRGRSKSPAAGLLEQKRKLQLPDEMTEHLTPFPELQGAALIRELHVYGQLIPTISKGSKTQHVGLGKQLMAEAERIAATHDAAKVAVIAGVGVRDFYRKIGYDLEGESEMMIKYLPKKLSIHAMGTPALVGLIVCFGAIIIYQLWILSRIQFV